MTPSFPLMDRRQWLHAGALGTVGLSLPNLLLADTISRKKPKSCIFIFAWGGPAQHETLDPKPDAPAEVRGEFKPISTRVPGIQISEHMPKLAKMTDRFAIIRSATHKFVVHNPGAYYALTGHAPDRDVIQFPATRQDWPSLGSLLARLRPTKETVPPYVLLPFFSNDINIPTPGQHAGFMSVGFDPLIINSDPSKRDFSVPALTPREELPAERMAGRRALLNDVNGQVSRWTDSVQGLDRHMERAFDLVTSAASKKAFDINQEPVEVRERYGKTRHCQSVLMARRLIEAGTRLVLVNDNEDNGQNKRWDTHGGGFGTLKKNLPETDGALAALLDDLSDRGLLDTTLVVWMGEFGRSPKADKDGGRDHWPHCYSVLLAGCGIKGGQVYGASDSRAAYPRENPVSPEDIHATIYHALGLADDTTIQDALGRPLALYHGRPVTQLY